jgi:hypothetical protein
MEHGATGSLGLRDVLLLKMPRDRLKLILQSTNRTPEREPRGLLGWVREKQIDTKSKTLTRVLCRHCLRTTMGIGGTFDTILIGACGRMISVRRFSLCAVSLAANAHLWVLATPKGEGDGWGQMVESLRVAFRSFIVQCTIW